MPVRPPLPRSVILLGWVSFFADISGEMVYPLIPMFVVDVLGASAVTLGGIEGGAQLAVALMTAWAGWRSDRRGRRLPYVRLGYGLPVLGKALLAGAIGWPLVLTGRLIDRLGKGVRASPRDALIADAAGPEMRGRAFGFHRAMDTAGAVLGVLLSAALLWWFAGTPRGDGAHAFQGADAGRAFRLVFAIAAALGLVSLVITFMAKEPARPALAPQAGERSPHRSSNRPSFSGSYWRTLALLLVFSLANSSDTFLLLRARDVGLSPWSVVLAYALCNIVYAAASYPAGIVSDRLGRWRVIAVGWLIYAAVYAGMAVTGPVGVWPLLALYGVYMALTDGVSKALIADHAPPQARGTALGIFHATSGIFALAASLIAGLLWTRVAPPAAFWFAAAAALTAVALVPVLRTRAPSPAPPR